MRQILRGAIGVALLAGLAIAPRLASASPVTYYFAAGTMTISVTTGANPLLVVPMLPLDGDQVTFNDDVENAGANPELTNIQLVVNAAGPYMLSLPYNGYDTVSVTNLALSPATGYSGSATLQAPGPPVDNYSYLGGPLKLTANVTVSDSTLANHPVPLVVAFNVVNPAANGTLLVNSVTGNVALLGITIGVVPAQGLEPDPLVIKGDFFFRGVIPEPATALLLGSGLIGLLAAGRRVRA